MRFTTSSLLSLLAAVSSTTAVPSARQQSGTETLQAVLKFAQDAGLTSFVDAVNAVATSGDQNVAPIVSGLVESLNGPLALFVPNNEAFGRVPESVSSNTTLLANILSYHVVQGKFGDNGTLFTSESPNKTIGRTLLNSTGFVDLEGGKSQVLVWSLNGTTIEIDNQPNATRVVNTAVTGNYTVAIIDRVLTLPGDIEDTLEAGKLNALEGLVGQVEGLDLDDLKGFTIFAPNDKAIQDAASTIQSVAGNQTVLTAILGNHLINGTTVYSSEVSADAKPVSAAGQQFSFAVNDTGVFVTSGEATAQIVQTDLLAENGVVHIIDRVLANTASNPEAAASAAADASNAATAAPEASATGPVGGNTGSGNGAASHGVPIFITALGLLAGVTLCL